MRRFGIETFVAAALALGLGIACTGGQSGNEGAGLDAPGSGLDAGPDGGTVGVGHPGAGTGGTSAPNDFGNNDGGVDEDDAGSEGGDDDGGVVPPPVTGPALHGNDEVCAASSIDAPIDCLDVCGTLSLCDASIACDDCLTHCAASAVGPIAGHRCLSRVVYLIDEEGCASMVRAYQAYLAEPSCGE